MNAGRPTATVALTFDDGPDPVWTPLVLDALFSARAPATFFVVAPRARRFPDLLSRMRQEGHSIAFHCTAHVRHDALTPEEIRADLESGLATLGRSVSYWRAPWGVVTPATGQIAREHGLTLAGWTADTQDWRGYPHTEMLDRVQSGISTRAIVLMHDGIGPGATREDCAETVALVEPLVSLARSRGLKPTRLHELPHPLPDRNPDFPAVKTGVR